MKRYAYSYDGSALAARRPLTRQQILDMLNTRYEGNNLDKYEIYELVPVKPVTTTVIDLESE
jgi:hypothetical protein